MLMKLQNKMTLSLKQLVKKTKKEGGVPSVVELDIQEASQLLDEINRMRTTEEVRNSYTIKTEKEDAENGRLILYRKGGIGRERRNNFLRAWHEGTYSIYFDEIPLKIVAPKKQVKTQVVPDPGPQKAPDPGPQVAPSPGYQSPPSPGPQGPRNGELTLTE